jgi:hypothetical protein
VVPCIVQPIYSSIITLMPTLCHPYSDRLAPSKNLECEPGPRCLPCPALAVVNNKHAAPGLQARVAVLVNICCHLILN